MSRVAREAWERNGDGPHADRRTKRMKTRAAQKQVWLDEGRVDNESLVTLTEWDYVDNYES